MGAQLGLLDYVPPQRIAADGALPLVPGDGSTWWAGAIVDAAHSMRVAHLAPATWNNAAGECWHIAVFRLPTGDVQLTIKPMTAEGVQVFLQHAGFDVAAARWLKDTQRGAVPYVRVHTPGGSPEMYFGNPWDEHPANPMRKQKRARGKVTP